MSTEEHKALLRRTYEAVNLATGVLRRRAAAAQHLQASMRSLETVERGREPVYAGANAPTVPSEPPTSWQEAPALGGLHCQTPPHQTGWTP